MVQNYNSVSILTFSYQSGKQVVVIHLTDSLENRIEYTHVEFAKAKLSQKHFVSQKLEVRIILVIAEMV